MKVTALAEALMGSRRTDGAISLPDLQNRLSRAGLQEFARAVASLRRGERAQGTERLNDPKKPWI
jgi:hypothetical protein